MTGQAEMNKTTRLLFVLLLLLQARTIRSQNCPSLPVNNLTCYNDYKQNITCVWNSTYMSDDCKIHAEYATEYYAIRSSCSLKPLDVSRPALKNCSMLLSKDPDAYMFQTFQNFKMTLTCNTMKQSVIMYYMPVCHVKLDAPPKPNINLTTVSWLAQVTKHREIYVFNTELQCKKQNRPWTVCDCILQWNLNKDVFHCQLDNETLMKGERYEARVRVQSVINSNLGAWSDWSPTASWVSSVGKEPQGIAVDLLHFYIVAGVAVFALLLVFVISRAEKTWVYMVKGIPKIPNPANSFLQDAKFESWVSPHFTKESFHSFWKPVDTVSVEVTSTVDVAAFCRPDEKMMRNESSYESTSSSFSNPSYSNLCAPPPPVSLHSAGNLEPCDADTPYGPVACQSEGTNTEKDNNDVTEKEMEILKLLPKGSGDSDPVQVISDYEKVEKVQGERFRLWSRDSGMCSCEEVIPESLEADSINVAESHDQMPEEDKEKEGGHGIKVNILKLLGSSGAIFGKESIQVCSDYERVQAVHSPEADSPELPSLDSGVSSGGEEQLSQEESMEDDKSTESTRFLFPPHPSSALPCSMLSMKQLPLNFSGPGFSPALKPQHDHRLEDIMQMSGSRSVEPCADGYMPVRQEQS
ncbi:interleukin-2 receptor subunit beta-like [Acanthochromis polyacanthus]|uniref:Interleukin-2 receptor subunit beta-like n=1 Tax=Acanthochromis polyacanthus TaxID=80966 RepID=A0A3Q1EIF4_9TELE|nr:interleukin-2 receptor subunit beta-like [Acanthochromis polyacanthus]XP_051801825.1 interleukin-2 receptor subunit beta-like [Acanthochromis polyacanthus]